MRDKDIIVYQSLVFTEKACYNSKLIANPYIAYSCRETKWEESSHLEQNKLLGQAKAIACELIHRGRHHCLEKHKLSRFDPMWSLRTVTMLSQHLNYYYLC